MTSIDDHWDFTDPAASEARFREAIEKAPTRSVRLQLLTQLGRSLGLQSRFDEALAVLDAIERDAAADSDPHIRVRLALERGRVFNSMGDRGRAQPLFDWAWQSARREGLDALAVDTAHMLAIVADGDEVLRWNEQALALAEASPDPLARRWVASLHNNIGWTHHERGQFETALHHFHLALEARKHQFEPRDVLIARWCVARCLRSLGRIDEALAEQQALLDAWQQLGESDGYVHQELAECLAALGRDNEAAERFNSAQNLLRADQRPS